MATGHQPSKNSAVSSVSTTRRLNVLLTDLAVQESHIDRLFRSLARMHGKFWGERARLPGLRWVNSVADDVFGIAAGEVNKAWDNWATKVVDPGSADPPFLRPDS